MATGVNRGGDAGMGFIGTISGSVSMGSSASASVSVFFNTIEGTFGAAVEVTIRAGPLIVTIKMVKSATCDKVKGSYGSGSLVIEGGLPIAVNVSITRHCGDHQAAMHALAAPFPEPTARYSAARVELLRLAGESAANVTAAPGEDVARASYPMEIIEGRLSTAALPGGLAVESASVRAFAYGEGEEDSSKTWIVEVNAKASIEIPVVEGAVVARASLLLTRGGAEGGGFKLASAVMFAEFSVSAGGLQLQVRS